MVLLLPFSTPPFPGLLLACTLGVLQTPSTHTTALLMVFRWTRLVEKAHVVARGSSSQHVHPPEEKAELRACRAGNNGRHPP